MGYKYRDIFTLQKPCQSEEDTHRHGIGSAAFTERVRATGLKVKEPQRGCGGRREGKGEGELSEINTKGR